MSNTPNIKTLSPAEFFHSLEQFAQQIDAMDRDQPEETCDCGLPIEVCESQYKSIEPTEEGLAHLSALADEADSLVDEIIAGEEIEERRDAISLLGLALKDNSEALSTYSRLVEAEFQAQV